jgi:hypothetical protein
VSREGSTGTLLGLCRVLMNGREVLRVCKGWLGLMSRDGVRVMILFCIYVDCDSVNEEML